MEKKRVVIASTALSMGINFPDVRYVIHWRPPRNLLDYHQQSGRAGRDNTLANVIILYYGQQTSLCEVDVKYFVNAFPVGCYRIAAYKPFDHKVQSVLPAHKCCNNCAQTCKCEGDSCSVQIPQHDLKPAETEGSPPVMTRPVSDCDREDLQDGQFEVINLIFNTLTLPDVHPDYTKQLVESILERSHTIFTVNDIVDHLPVFSIQHALKIVELFNEIFQDIPNLDTMVEILSFIHL